MHNYKCLLLQTNSPNVMIVVSAILETNMSGLPATQSSVVPPKTITSTSPGHRVMAVVECSLLGRVPSGSVTWR